MPRLGILCGSQLKLWTVQTKSPRNRVVKEGAGAKDRAVGCQAPGEAAAYWQEKNPGSVVACKPSESGVLGKRKWLMVSVETGHSKDSLHLAGHWDVFGDPLVAGRSSEWEPISAPGTTHYSQWQRHLPARSA